MAMDLDDLNDLEEPELFVHSWVESCQQVTHQLLNEEMTRFTSRKIRKRSHISVDTSSNLRSSRGDEVVRNVLRSLDSFFLDNGERLFRSREQKLFHYLWIQAFFPFIYGEHWHAHSERVLHNAPALFGFPQSLSRVFYEVLCLTPRRYGKTWAVAMFVAAMIYEVPGIVFANFSTGKRASGWVMQDVLHFFKQLPDAKSRVIKGNQEQLYISEFTMADKHAHTGRIAQFNSFPSTVDGKMNIDRMRSSGRLV